MDEAELDAIMAEMDECYKLYNTSPASSSAGDAHLECNDESSSPVVEEGMPQADEHLDCGDESPPASPEVVRRKTRHKKSSKSKRARKRARMIAFSDEEPESAVEPPPRRRRRTIASTSDEIAFTEPDSAPESPPESPPNLGDILDCGNDLMGDSLFGEELEGSGEDLGDSGDDAPSAAPAKGKAATSTTDESDVRKLDVRADELVSSHPPTMIFMMGKTRTSAVPVTLVGDLVRELSCPMHTFRVSVKPVPGSVSDNGSPVLYVLDVIKVLNGPIPDAEKDAQTVAEVAGSAIVGDCVARVSAARIKRSITASGYLKRATHKSAIVKKIFARLSDKYKNEPLTPAHLEEFAPAESNSQVSWMCRNALESLRFFMAANKIGGSAVRAIGLDTNKAAWDMINGVTPEVEEDEDRRQERLIDLLKKIHFANPLSEFRASRLHESLGVDNSRELSDMAECIVRAAAVAHNLPSSSSVQDDRYRNSIVRGEQGDVWPEPMLRLLRLRGLHVDRDSSQRWYACRQQTRQFFNNVVDTMSTGSVKFIRAEIDDDHTVADENRGYIERLRTAVSEHMRSLLVLSKTGNRIDYLKHHTGGYRAKFLEYNVFMGNFAPKESTVIWVDRAHLLTPHELTRLLEDFSKSVKAIYLTGSIWAGTTRFEVTLFAQLFAGANNSSCETLTAGLAEYKAAPVGSDPLAEGAKEKIPGTPLIIGRLSSACPDNLSTIFPDSRIFSVAQLAEAFDVISNAAIVLYDTQWTREDLATVWQHVYPVENAIWMLGGADWRPSLLRSSRSTAGSTALMQKAAAG